MKRIYFKITFILVVALAFFTTCKKVPDGFLSDYVRYEEDPILVPKGRVYVSKALNPDGSAKPLKVTLLNIRNKVSGEDVTETFMQKYKVSVWRQLYNSKTDTTLEMIDAKRVDSMIYPININPESGQIESNYGTVNLPVGSYTFDLEISNSAGRKKYANIGNFNVIDTPAYEIPAARSTVAMKVGAESTTKTLPKGRLEVVKTGDSENKITVHFVDENGSVFNPKAGEVARRPNSGNNPGYLQTMQDYSLKYQSFEDRMEFIYGVVPFPLSSLGNGFNYYYRIPAQYVHFDESLGLPDNTYSCNARFSFRTFEPGSYDIKVIIEGVTRK